MKEIITCFFEEYGYPDEAVHTLQTVYESILHSDAARELFACAREEYARSPKLDCAQYLNRLRSICSEESIPWESASMLFYICLVPQLHQYYREYDLPDSLCRASLEDLKWKLQECHQVYGVWGSAVSDWFTGFFALCRFTLGRLQFELVPFPESYENAGRTKPAGLHHAINVHIPSSGPLLHDECIHSYHLAADFFRKQYPSEINAAPAGQAKPDSAALSDQPTAFVCDSWLLFPQHTEFLPAHFRILEFMKDFDIYASRPSNGDLWRIFGQPDCSDTASLPEDTSLRKAYKQWILSGGTPGTGTGLFLL